MPLLYDDDVQTWFVLYKCLFFNVSLSPSRSDLLVPDRTVLDRASSQLVTLNGMENAA